MNVTRIKSGKSYTLPKKCKHCKSKSFEDFTSNIFDELAVHFYCLDCGSHYYKNKWYTKEHWNKFSNLIREK